MAKIANIQAVKSERATNVPFAGPYAAPRSAIVFWCLAVASSSAMASAAEPSLAFPVSEAPFTAQLAGIDREWNVSFKTAGKLRLFAAADLAYWGRYSDAEAGPQIVLLDGSMIRADVLLLDDAQLILGDATGLGRGFWDESSLPRQSVRAIMFQPPAAPLDRDRLWRDLASYAKADDRLLLVGGETIEGTLTAAPRTGRFAAEKTTPGSDAFRFISRGSALPLTIPAVKVVAIQLGSTAHRARPVVRMSGWLGFVEGSLIRATSIQVKGDVATLGLALGGELQTTLPSRDDPERRFWESVAYLEPETPKVSWLADQSSLAYKQIPFVSVEWPVGVNQSVLGGRLRAGSALFPHGIGMPSASRLACDVAGYRRFEAEVAIDQAAGLLGSVVFKVLLETTGRWTTVYESPVVRGGDKPLPVSIDLKGSGRLALLVEFADRGDVCDYADWLSARLTR